MLGIALPRRSHDIVFTWEAAIDTLWMSNES
jgi:hypothetical protein